MELEPEREGIRAQYGVEFISSEDMFNIGLERRSAIVRNHKQAVLAVQFIYSDHLLMLSQMKSDIELNSKVSKVIFLIHLERDPRRRQLLKSNIGINYWKDWDNRVLDSLSHSDYEEYCKTRDMTFEDLLVSEQFEMGISLFKEACLLCIMKIAHEQADSSLQLNMFNIRHMIEHDPNSTFVNSFRQTIKRSNILDKSSQTWV